MILRGVENVIDGTVLTVDRALYEKGGGEDEDFLHFASYGDDVFDRILQLYEAYDLPGCVARLTEAVPDLKAEVVGYAVACIGEDGSKTCRLITSWADLDGLVLDEDGVPTEADLSRIKQQLHDLMRKEFDPTRAVPRLEQENRRAGHCQILLDLLVADRLLPPFDVSPAENFWATVNDLYRLAEQREELLVPKLPVPVLQRLKGATLVEIPTPQVGETTDPVVPIKLVEAGLDAACRVADAMKVKRTNLSIDAVKRRLQREKMRWT
jgi:hypothetical protein